MRLVLDGFSLDMMMIVTGRREKSQWLKVVQVCSPRGKRMVLNTRQWQTLYKPDPLSMSPEPSYIVVGQIMAERRYFRLLLCSLEELKAYTMPAIAYHNDLSAKDLSLSIKGPSTRMQRLSHVTGNSGRRSWKLLPSQRVLTLLSSIINGFL